MEFKCAECGKELNDEVPIMVDCKGLPPLDFCSWDCLMKYVVKKHNAEHATVSSKLVI